MKNRKDKQTSGWSLISIPGYFISAIGGAADSGFITISGLLICALGCVIWAVTYNPDADKKIINQSFEDYKRERGLL